MRYTIFLLATVAAVYLVREGDMVLGALVFVVALYESVKDRQRASESQASSSSGAQPPA